MTNFLIIGNMNAITYKEIFPYIKNNQLWVGYRSLGSEFYFNITDEYKKEIVKEKKEGSGWKEIDGEICGRVANACWFTNLDISKRREFIGLTKKYNPTDYPKYDNYDAIEVGRVDDIPKDYDGVMGVPITFLGKHNPNQFEIIGLDRYVEDNPNYGRRFHLNGKETYARILIRKVKEEHILNK